MNGVKSGLTRIRDLKLTSWFAWGRNQDHLRIRGGMGNLASNSPETTRDKVLILSGAFFPAPLGRP